MVDVWEFGDLLDTEDEGGRGLSVSIQGSD